MNGILLVTELREKRPGLRALILSGGEIPADFGGQELTFLEKPIEHPVMVQVVRNLIGARA